MRHQVSFRLSTVGLFSWGPSAWAGTLAPKHPCPFSLPALLSGIKANAPWDRRDIRGRTPLGPPATFEAGPADFEDGEKSWTCAARKYAACAVRPSAARVRSVPEI